MSSEDLAELIEVFVGGDTDAAIAAVEALNAATLDQLTSGTAEGLNALASALSKSGARWRARDDDGSDPYSTSARQGHLRGLLGLVRLALLRRMPAESEDVLRQKQVPQLLRVLVKGDRTLTALADEIGIDLSYAERKVNRLAAAELVRTARKGRERWITLTASGRAAFQRIRQRSTAVRRGHARELRDLAQAVAEMKDQQHQVEQSIEKLRQDVVALLAERSSVLQPQPGSPNSDWIRGLPATWTGWAQRPHTTRAVRPWHEVVERHKEGEKVIGRVISVGIAGAEVQLLDQSAGVIPRSEFSDGALGFGGMTAGDGTPTAGKTYMMQIVRLDAVLQKVVLTMRGGSGLAHPDEDRRSFIIPPDALTPPPDRPYLR